MTDKLTHMPRWRILVLGLLMSMTLYSLASKLHTLQILESGAYAKSQYRQSLRRVLIPAPRGRIFDRHGVCLADNRPSYCVALFIEELRQPGRWSNTINAVEAELDKLSTILELPRELTRDDISRHIAARLPLPLLAWQDISPRALARFSESMTPDSCADVYVQPERVYPHGALASHLLGYIGRDIPTVEGESFHYNVMGMKGRAGIEASMNSILAGEPGGRLITVDVFGYRHSETNRPAVPGRDLRLTIDASLQQYIEALLDGNRAAVVAVNPQNGEILSLVSRPGFDPNAMSPSVSHRLWRQLINDKSRPLLNRAVSGSYPPGSVFKPCVALAALEAGISPDAKFSCNGVFTLGGMRLRCSSSMGHGENLTIRYGLEQSCNPLFCSLGVQTGIDAIYDFSSRMGFGSRSGICLGGESAGLLPSDAWKRRVRRDGWRAGDSANLAIGQGFLLATPLQLGMYAAALANCGTLYKPRLVMPEDEDAPGEVVNVIKAPARHWEIVRGGMYDVVNALRGTGRRARVDGIAVAAKTGTAEYGPRSARKKHTWMIAFAPYEKPEIALAVLVEDGDSGGKTVAPIVNAILRKYFNLPEQSEELKVNGAQMAPQMTDASAEATAEGLP